MQNYRLIVRWSYNNDHGSRVSQKVLKELAKHGVQKTGFRGKRTATAEGWGLTPSQGAGAVRRFWEIVGNPAANVANPDPTFHIDHVWIYFEEEPAVQHGDE